MDESKTNQSAQGPDSIQFERFELIPYSGELKRDGVSTLLGRRTLKLLMVLLEAQGEMVTNESLLSEVWPGLIVETNTLQVHVSQLRKALGDSRHLLRTFKGQGYALLANRQTRYGAISVTPGAADHELSFAGSKFIGRVRELKELSLLATSSPLLSLVGAGGVGKTRLAIELAHQLSEQTGLATCIVDLAPTTSSSRVRYVTASALGVGATANQDITEALFAALANQSRILLFDNCEYVAEEVARFVTELLDRTPGLAIIVTSQKSLGAAAEQVYRVKPLSLAPEPRISEQASDAERFFIDRAAVLDQSFAPTLTQLNVILRICQRLDGVPLAIEMAVARLRVLGLDELHASLDQRLEVIRRDSSEDIDERYPTLRAMLDWNHGLLDATEQDMFRRLAIFPASFALDAALYVTEFGEVDRWILIDAISDLIDKSLITVDSGEPPRYRMLETIRIYGLEKLDAAGERELASERHANYYCDLFDRASGASEVTLPETGTGIYRFEFDNIRTAMQWALAMPDRANVAISLAGSACHAWREFSFLEGRQYVDDALALVSDLTPLPIAARLYKQAGTLWYTSDEGRGLRMWEKAADAFRAIPDSSNLAQTLSVIGHLYSRANRNEEAKRVLYEALDLVRSSGDKRLNELMTLSGLGILHSNLREPEEARRLFNEAQHIAQEIGDVVQEQVALANLSELEYQFGDIDRAIDIGNTVITNLRAMPRGGLKQFLRAVTTTVGSYLLIRGRKSEALDKVREALLLAREEGGLGVTACIELAAYFAAEHRESRQAAEMLGFADARYQATASLRNPSEELVREQIRNRILLEISGSEFESHAKAGQQWTEEHAMEMAETYLA